MSTCGAKIKHADNDDDEHLVLPETEIKYIQKAVGITSYYPTALANTNLMALNVLVSSQSTAKQSAKDVLSLPLDYLSTHSSAKNKH